MSYTKEDRIEYVESMTHKELLFVAQRMEPKVPTRLLKWLSREFLITWITCRGLE